MLIGLRVCMGLRAWLNGLYDSVKSLFDELLVRADKRGIFVAVSMSGKI